TLDATDPPLFYPIESTSTDGTRYTPISWHCVTGVSAWRFVRDMRNNLSASSFPRLPMVEIASIRLDHFYATARWNNPRAEIESFLLSKDGYIPAHLCGILEIAIGSQAFPDWYTRFVTSHTIVGGAVLTTLGQVIRTVAMMQAGHNFNHQIEKQSREDHELVTTGLYSWSRHPSYIGIYLLFVGIQVMVGNIIVGLFSASILWVCLERRIQFEEKCLVEIFGVAYLTYTKQVPRFPSFSVATDFGLAQLAVEALQPKRWSWLETTHQEQLFRISAHTEHADVT
ncbi:hypothetical protein D6C78_07608, partial [Aureobasidium pullulans]